ncbi:hypothetical protein Desti_3529 [Desulfomonile tiedjei DSM 6799]|uniref:Uncharacterized protein n=1 Tax=Desulfomonile tiedjei (strain ATCC 49306 / DSM 6799 / DCB-1) TaxID=706587 RepID=I4C9D8_DESTA|nr:hypothetical protein Desti_3529 [Desulfomonile tiedjei DSM 6799]
MQESRNYRKDRTTAKIALDGLPKGEVIQFGPCNLRGIAPMLWLPFTGGSGANNQALYLFSLAVPHHIGHAREPER